MNPEVKQWIDMANMDLGVAKHLNANYFPKPLEIICYHSQQAAEKAIKALIIYYGAQGGLPRIHALSMLLRQICSKVSIEEKYYDYADVLTPYGTAVRYPNEIYLEEHHATTAIQYAEEIVRWVEDTIAKRES